MAEVATRTPERFWNKQVGWFDPNSHSINLDKEGIGWVSTVGNWALMQDYKPRLFDQLTPAQRELAEAVQARGRKFFEENGWSKPNLEAVSQKVDLAAKPFTGSNAPDAPMYDSSEGKPQPQAGLLIDGKPIVAGSQPPTTTATAETPKGPGAVGTPKGNPNKLTYNEFARAVAAARKKNWDIPDVAAAIKSGGEFTDEERKKIRDTPWDHLVGEIGLDGRILDKNDAIAAARDSFTAGVRDYNASLKGGGGSAGSGGPGGGGGGPTVNVPGVGQVPAGLAAKVLQSMTPGVGSSGDPMLEDPAQHNWGMGPSTPGPGAGGRGDDPMLERAVPGWGSPSTGPDRFLTSDEAQPGGPANTGPDRYLSEGDGQPPPPPPAGVFNNQSAGGGSYLDPINWRDLSAPRGDDVYTGIGGWADRPEPSSGWDAAKINAVIQQIMNGGGGGSGGFAMDLGR